RDGLAVVVLVRIDNHHGEPADRGEGNKQREDPPAPRRPRRPMRGRKPLIHFQFDPIRHQRISSTGSTPMTASPDAMTTATERASATRARVNSASPGTMNRRDSSSLPRFQKAWKAAARSV